MHYIKYNKIYLNRFAEFFLHLAPKWRYPVLLMTHYRTFSFSDSFYFYSADRGFDSTHEFVYVRNGDEAHDTVSHLLRLFLANLRISCPAFHHCPSDSSCFFLAYAKSANEDAYQLEARGEEEYTDININEYFLLFLFLISYYCYYCYCLLYTVNNK